MCIFLPSNGHNQKTVLSIRGKHLFSLLEYDSSFRLLIISQVNLSINCIWPNSDDNTKVIYNKCNPRSYIKMLRCIVGVTLNIINDQPQVVNFPTCILRMNIL